MESFHNAHLTIQVEAGPCFSTDIFQARPADILVLHWDPQGMPAAFDVTLVSPLNANVLSAVGAPAGAASETAELRKHIFLLWLWWKSYLSCLYCQILQPPFLEVPGYQSRVSEQGIGAGYQSRVSEQGIRAGGLPQLTFSTFPQSLWSLPIRSKKKYSAVPKKGKVPLLELGI